MNFSSLKAMDVVDVFQDSVNYLTKKNLPILEEF